MRRRALAGAGAALALTGCEALVRTGDPLPMDRIDDFAACPRTLAPTRLVLLPGAYMAPAELLREGFVAALRARGIAADVTVPDSSLRYVYDRSVMQRLHDEVVLPARAQGVRRLWFAGISLGGFLSLQYARLHPGALEGVFVIAPYLGSRPFLQGVAAAGGPAAWRAEARPPRADLPPGDDVDHALWTWLTGPGPRPPLWLGAGSGDRLAEGHRLLAGLLPAERVFSEPGGHDWPPWRTLWARWLDAAPLPRVAAGGCSA